MLCGLSVVHPFNFQCWKLVMMPDSGCIQPNICATNTPVFVCIDFYQMGQFFPQKSLKPIFGFNLENFPLNKSLLCHYLFLNEETQWRLSLWPTNERLCICSITWTQGATFKEKNHTVSDVFSPSSGWSAGEGQMELTQQTHLSLQVL